MACHGCMQRRVIGIQMIRAARAGDAAALRQSVNQMANTFRVDASKLKVKAESMVGVVMPSKAEEPEQSSAPKRTLKLRAGSPQYPYHGQNKT